MRGAWFHAERVPEENVSMGESVHLFWHWPQRIDTVFPFRCENIADRFPLCIGDIDRPLGSKHEIRSGDQPLEGVFPQRLQMDSDPCNQRRIGPVRQPQSA